MAQQKNACFVLCFFFTLLTKKTRFVWNHQKKFSLSLFPSTNAKKFFQSKVVSKSIKNWSEEQKTHLLFYIFFLSTTKKKALCLKKICHVFFSINPEKKTRIFLRSSEWVNCNVVTGKKKYGPFELMYFQVLNTPRQDVARRMANLFRKGIVPCRILT